MKAKNWQQILGASASMLSQAGIENAAVDARWLLAHALKISPDRLTIVLRDAVDTVALARFDHYLQRRCLREPVSQILGGREFYGRRFMINADVLDPRPETELLVQIALAIAPTRVLDLGTGSGCVLLSILAEIPTASGVGCDLSAPALVVAQKNAKRLGLDGRTAFVQSDWFASIGDRFDLIVTNPPYISASEMSDLQPEVRNHEPYMALCDGGDGLGAYRAITAGTLARLTPGGRLIVEIGSTQRAAVTQMFAASGLKNIECRRDLAGHDRVLFGNRLVQG